MKNKAKIIILICAVAAIGVVVLYKPTTTEPVGATAPNKDAFKESRQHPPLSAQIARDHKHRDADNQTSTELEALKVIENGLRSLESEEGQTRAKRARSGNAAMESLLKSWNPIGRKPHDLKALFGKPKEESDDFLLYAFDNGSYAWLYLFVIRNGTVVELTRPLSE